MTGAGDAGFDVAAALDEIEAATGELLACAGQLADTDMRAASLLPG